MLPTFSPMRLSRRPKPFDSDGKLLFEQIVKMNLGGMVCKRKSSPYRATEKPSPYWIKVKNPRYSRSKDKRNYSNERSNLAIGIISSN